MENNRPSISIDELPKLKRAYNKAVKEGKESFMFEDAELVTSYAKYLIEYFESLLKRKEK